MTDRKQGYMLLVVLRFPGREAGQWSYAVMQPGVRSSDVYEIASSWFDTEGEALAELKRMRERRGGLRR